MVVHAGPAVRVARVPQTGLGAGTGNFGKFSRDALRSVRRLDPLKHLLHRSRHLGRHLLVRNLRREHPSRVGVRVIPVVHPAQRHRLDRSRSNIRSRLQNPLVDVHPGLFRFKRPHGDARFTREQRPGRLLHVERRRSRVLRVRQLGCFWRYLPPFVPKRSRPRVFHNRRRVRDLLAPPHRRHDPRGFQLEVRAERGEPRLLRSLRGGGFPRGSVRLRGGYVASVLLNLSPGFL